jgi:hypothetical protein
MFTLWLIVLHKESRDQADRGLTLVDGSEDVGMHWVGLFVLHAVPSWSLICYAIIRSFSTISCFRLNSSSEAFRSKFDIQVAYPVTISELYTWS